jgi:hypothetical protein
MWGAGYGDLSPTHAYRFVEVIELGTCIRRPGPAAGSVAPGLRAGRGLELRPSVILEQAISAGLRISFELRSAPRPGERTT